MPCQTCRKYLAVPLVVVLLLAAIPAAAGEIPKGEAFSLRLEEIQLVETPVVEAELVEVVASEEVPPVGISELQSVIIPEAIRMSQVASDQASTQTKDGGFGRWMKKHWYVPVLAAVVLGVVLIGDNDNDKEGDDD